MKVNEVGERLYFQAKVQEQRLHRKVQEETNQLLTMRSSFRARSPGRGIQVCRVYRNMHFH